MGPALVARQFVGAYEIKGLERPTGHTSHCTTEQTGQEIGLGVLHQPLVGCAERPHAFEWHMPPTVDLVAAAGTAQMKIDPSSREGFECAAQALLPARRAPQPGIAPDRRRRRTIPYHPEGLRLSTQFATEHLTQL